MTTPPPGPPPWQQPPPAGQPAPQPKRRRKWPWIVAAVAVLGFGGCVAVGLAAVNEVAKDPVATGARSLQPTAGPTTADPTEEATTPPADDYVPSVKDFTLAVKVLDKQCFGSAGCNLQYRVDFKAINPRVPDDGSFEVTYQIRGGESPSIGTITVEGGKYDPPEEYIQTTSSAKVLTAVVTDVAEG